MSGAGSLWWLCRPAGNAVLSEEDVYRSMSLRSINRYGEFHRPQFRTARSIREPDA
jgi:hypothetical protein